MLKSVYTPAMIAGTIGAFAMAAPAIAADTVPVSMALSMQPTTKSTPLMELIDSIPTTAASASARELTNSIPGADEYASAPLTSLNELSQDYADMATPRADQECLAAAVYFEARGEPNEGQIAVAEVVLNRAASGKYPTSICAVVTQPAQFSFVRRGRIPPIAKATEAWRTALAIAHVAGERHAHEIGPDVLWYHANYVSPAWDRQLVRVTQIGAHIFYSGSG